MAHKDITIIGETVMPGESKTINMEIARLHTMTKLKNPIIVERSKLDGPVVLFTAGLHGDDEALLRQLLQLQLPVVAALLCVTGAGVVLATVAVVVVCLLATSVIAASFFGLLMVTVATLAVDIVFSTTGFLAGSALACAGAAGTGCFRNSAYVMLRGVPPLVSTTTSLTAAILTTKSRFCPAI